MFSLHAILPTIFYLSTGAVSMLNDYIENIQYIASDRKRGDAFFENNDVFRLPRLFPRELADYRTNPSKVIEELTQPILESGTSEFIVVSDFVSHNSVYTLYTIKTENISKVFTQVADELFQEAQQNDLIVRTELSKTFELFFEEFFVADDFKEKFFTDLKTKSVSTDFRVSGSFGPDRFIEKSTYHLVDINIKFTPEHESFLRKVLNIKTTFKLLYRGYVSFNGDFTVREFKLKLFSENDLHLEHLEYYRSSPTYGFIRSTKKAHPYAYDQNPKSFFTLFTKEDYKFTLYKLLKFHNDSDTLAKYTVMFPELYRPSAYDFANLSLEEWDTRFILQDMIDI